MSAIYTFPQLQGIIPPRILIASLFLKSDISEHPLRAELKRAV